ncbi:MAG: family 78 glycoside hydrolase catalytic domain [bacterium]|nr:family 78 glycoside hydrolase catalytic domain [bacterium]
MKGKATVIFVFTILAGVHAANAGISVQSATCEYRENPLGVDTPIPRLSWILGADERAQVQTAYHILVASDRETLEREQGDLWDSRKVLSGQSLNVSYAGKPLSSLARCFWKVRAWDRDGNASEWSAPAFWQMGLLDEAAWAGARWVKAPEADPGDGELLSAWIWHPKQRTQPGSRVCFRREIEVSPEAGEATIELTADDSYALYVNGKRVGANDNWKMRVRHVLRVGEALRPGTNVIGVVARNKGTDARGLIVGVRLGKADGGHVLPVDGWRCATVDPTGWLEPGFDDSDWVAPEVLAEYGDQPWGTLNAAAALRPLPLFRREIPVDKPVARATLSVCGLGQCEVWLNGRKVGKAIMDPGWTDYGDTCLYATHDVTERVVKGGNAIGIMLGNGMYNVAGGRYTKFRGSYGPPKAILHLDIRYDDGSQEALVTDGAWACAPGPITFSCIYGGEDYDARRSHRLWCAFGYDAADWTSAEATGGPGGVLRAQSAPPIKVMDGRVSVDAKVLGPGTVVYDLGQNASGVPCVTVRGPEGTTIRLTPGEKISPDGRVDQGNIGSPSYFEYTLSGKRTQTWHPRFMYTGFRYVQVDGAAPQDDSNPDGLPVVEAVEGLVTRNSAETIGSFECSNDLFNRIDTLIDWAVMSNMQSVLTDCPHREKLGWLEENHLMVQPIMYTYRVPLLLEKIARDIREAQLDNGMVPDIAPEYVQFNGGFRESAEWGSACVIMPWYAYQWYGDRRILEDQYAAMARYVAYLESTATNHIAKPGLGDWYDYVPGQAPGSSKLTPTTLTATAIYHYDVTILEKVARILGKTGDAGRYAELAAAIREAFNKEWFHADTNQYAEGSQTANAMALYMGIAPEGRRAAVLDNLVADVLAKWQTAGDVGHRYLIRALADNGRSDVVYAMTNRTESPSYGGILETGATSLTEAWDARPASSLNHFMLGHIQEWFQKDLAGIQPDPEAPGFKHFFVRPQAVGDLTMATGMHRSPHGLIMATHSRSNNTSGVRVAIPVNTTATVHVLGPETATVVETGKDVAQVEGVTALGYQNGAHVLTVGSGEYAFAVRNP